MPERSRADIEGNDNHLTTAYTSWLAPVLGRALQPLLPSPDPGLRDAAGAGR